VNLTDLHPKWFGLPQAAPSASDIKVGFTFDCPCSRCAENRGSTRLSVNIDPPIDPENKLVGTTWVTPQPAWKRIGDSFETITLQPSVDVSSRGHWHGYITNGEISFA
jgi:hypothetical protein